MVLLAIAISLLATAGCGGGDKDAGKAKEAKIINIGFTGPLSGGAAFYGKDTLGGLELAIDQVNANGGITIAGEKYNFKVVALDDRYLPNEAATNARRLVKESNTPIIFCPHSGGIAAMQEFNETENFLIMAYSSEPKLFERGNKLTLVMPPPYSSYIEPFTKKMMADYGKKVALIQGNHAYGKDWGALFAPAWEKAGGTITINSPFSYNTETDFSTYVSKALATKPDILFVGGASQPTAMVVKQARDQGFKGGLIVIDQAKIDDMSDIIGMPAMEGAIGVYPFYKYPRTDQQALNKFVESYKTKFGKRPNWEAGWHYESGFIVAKGIEKAGNVKDAAKIFAGMRQALPLDKKTVPIGIDGISPKGGYANPGSAVVVKNGQFSELVDIPRVGG